MNNATEIFEPVLLTKTLSDLLNSDFCLTVPEYQRAYEWESYHVKSLLEDTFNVYKKGNSYLMGAIILHKNEVDNTFKHDIIDGQQRLITLSILIHCLDENENTPLLNATFNNIKSFYFIKNTQREINSFIQNKVDLKLYKAYLKEKLAFSVLIISGHNAIDQAYTFFDSANSKGKSLTDFDLLKAHHLMYIPYNLDQLARNHNDFWQSNDDRHQELFSSILRRIRMWSRGMERDNHSDRNNFYEFISTVEPSEVEQNEHLLNRYMQPNIFRSWHRENDEVVLNIKYGSGNSESLIPFEIPQTIEGGDSFFLYAKRYHEMFELLFGENDTAKSSYINYVYLLSKSIDNDYLSMAYKAIMLLYYDKFGENQIIEVATATELILAEIRFKWKEIGSTRPSPIRIETILTKVKNCNLIPIVLSATISSHVVKLFINEISLSKREVRNSPTLTAYFSRIKTFYTNNKFKVSKEMVIEKLETVYFIETSENE